MGEWYLAQFWDCGVVMGEAQLNDPGNTLCYFVDENGSYTTIGNTKGEFKVGVRSSVLNIFIGGLWKS